MPSSGARNFSLVMNAVGSSAMLNSHRPARTVPGASRLPPTRTTPADVGLFADPSRPSSAGIKEGIFKPYKPRCIVAMQCRQGASGPHRRVGKCPDEDARPTRSSRSSTARAMPPATRLLDDDAPTPACGMLPRRRPWTSPTTQPTGCQDARRETLCGSTSHDLVVDTGEM